MIVRIFEVKMKRKPQLEATAIEHLIVCCGENAVIKFPSSFDVMDYVEKEFPDYEIENVIEGYRKLE